MSKPFLSEAWPGLMTVDQAAAYWSISPRKFRELVSDGTVKPRKVGPRIIRYSRRELDSIAETLPVGRGDQPAKV